MKIWLEFHRRFGKYWRQPRKINGNQKKLEDENKADFKEMDYINKINNLTGLDKYGSNIGRNLELK